MARKLQSITVGELKDILNDYDEEDQIAFASNYGDYGNTMQIHPITGQVDESDYEESGYSDSGFAVTNHPRTKVGTILILS